MYDTDISLEKLERWFSIENTSCSSRRLKYIFQHPCGGQQPPITPVPGYLAYISILGGGGHDDCTQMAHRHPVGRTPVHIK